MTGSDFGIFILGLIAVAIVVAIIVWLLHWLYLRSSKERSFVRTGLGGTKVVLGGGALVLPILHEVIPVNMNTLRLEVARGRDKALITKDRMRVDVISEFYVRVKADPQAVADAAQTLGTRTLAPDSLKELLEGKFVDALRTVAAEMTMEELHEKRGEYVKRVRSAVAGDLLKNGLELEAASLTGLDQTAMEFFNPSNAFDAEGLTRLTEQIEKRKKQRNDVEQDTMISIRTKNLEAEKLALDIDREAEHARLSQERQVEIARASQRAEVARERADKEQEAERAQIASREAIEMARILSERAVEEERIVKERELQSAEIERRKTIELAEQQRAIEVAKSSRAESEARGAADAARAKAASEEERVFTARETEIATRRKSIDLIEASKDAERDALRLKVAAAAEKSVAADRGDAIRAQAEADADADKIRSLALKVRSEIEARGHAPDERSAERADRRSPRVGAAARAGREARRNHPRVGQADGAHRRHQDPACRRPGRRWRGWRQQRRRPGRQRGQQRAAFPRAGTAGRPASARDRRAGRRPRPDRAVDVGYGVAVGEAG